MNKSIKKTFCLICGLFGLILPLITHISLWSFGFISGLGLAGWMLLSDDDKEEH